MYSVIAVAFLAVLSIGGGQAQERPDPCCFPERWEGGIRQHLTYHRTDAVSYGIRDAFLEYAYDYPNRRLAARIHSEHPDHYERFLLNFNEDRIYFIREDYCKFRHFREHHDFARACISESASYQGNFFLGLNKVTFNRWFTYHSENRESIVDVSSEGCVPGFSRGRHENSRYVTHIYQSYFNITSSLSDESIFETPSNCEEIQSEHFYDESEEGIIRMHAYHSLPFFRKEKTDHLNPKIGQK